MLRCIASRCWLLGVLALVGACLLPACGSRTEGAAKGRVRVELQVKPLVAAAKGAASRPLARADIDRTQQVLQDRVKAYGLPVPQAQFQPPDRIILEVAPEQPGGQLPEDLEGLLTQRGLLEVRALPTEYAEGHDKAPVVDDTAGSVSFMDAAGRKIPTERVLAKSTLLASSRDLVPNAKLESRQRRGQSPTQMVSFELREPARGRFREFTRTHVDTYLAFVLDGDLLTCPIIRSEVPGKGVITVPDRPSPAFPQFVAIMMNTGPLPLTVRWVSTTPGQRK